VSERDTLSAALAERDRAGLQLESLRRAAQFGNCDWAHIRRAVAAYRAAEAAIDAAVGAIWVPPTPSPLGHTGESLPAVHTPLPMGATP
jgi:hypothetical protein